MAAAVCANREPVRSQLQDLFTREVWLARSYISISIDVKSLTKLIEQNDVLRSRHQQQDYQRPDALLERHPMFGHLGGDTVSKGFLCFIYLRLKSEILNQHFDLISRTSQDCINAE